eukprot:jgi/Botrbrau1/3951/Bobra.0365s0026.1
MAFQAAHLGLAPGLNGQPDLFKPIGPRKHSFRIVRCTASRGSKAAGVRVGDAGAALLGFLTVLPEKVLAGELMVFDSAPDFSVPSLPEIPVDVASKLPNISFEPIQQLLGDYPLLIPAGALLAAVPAVGALFGGGGAGGKVAPTSAARAVEALSQDSRVLLLDIRDKDTVREYGTPDIRATKKKLYSLPYTKTVKGEYLVDETFPEKLKKLPALKEDSILILLDAFGKEAPEAGKLLVKEQIPNRIFFVQGGAEGPAGWKELELPWKEPLKLPVFAFSGLKDVGANLDTLAEDLKQAPTLGKAGLAVGGIAAGFALLATQLETVLEVAVAFAAGNYLFNLLTKPSTSKPKEFKVKVEEAGKELKAELQEVAKAVVDGAPPPPALEANGNGALAKPSADLTPKEEARQWIDNWRSKQKQLA